MENRLDSIAALRALWGVRRSVLLALLLAAPVLGAYVSLERTAREQLSVHVDGLAIGMMQALEEMVSSRLMLVEMLSREVAMGEVAKGAAFAQRAERIQAQLPGYQAINFINADGITSQVTPAEPNAGALGRQVRDHPVAGSIFAAAARTGEPQVTGALTLFQGGVGFASYFPIDGGGRGFVNGVFRIEPVLQQLLAGDRADIQVTVYVDGVLAGTAGATEVASGRDTALARTLWGHDWRLVVRPSASLARTSSPWGQRLLLLGLLGSVTIGILHARAARASIRHRALKDRLRQQEHLDTLGQLASGIAHDFNNLLMILQGNLELLRLQPPTDPDTLRDEVDALYQTCARGSAMTAELMAFARHSRREASPFQPDEVLRSTAQVLERMLPKAVSLATDLNAPKAELVGDPGSLQQAIFNLALNARDAMATGGILRIRTYRDGGLVIEVSDTGSGMPPEIQRQIFAPLFTTKRHGTGLGLPMVQRAVRHLGGSVEVWSKPDAGTRFTMRFPAA